MMPSTARKSAMGRVSACRLLTDSSNGPDGLNKSSTGSHLRRRRPDSVGQWRGAQSVSSARWSGSPLSVGLGAGHGAAPLPSEHRHRRPGVGGPGGGRGDHRRLRRRGGQRRRRVPRLRLRLHPALRQPQGRPCAGLGGTGRLRGRDAARWPGWWPTSTSARTEAQRRTVEAAPALRALRAAGRGPVRRRAAQDHRAARSGPSSTCPGWPCWCPTATGW